MRSIQLVSFAAFCMFAACSNGPRGSASTAPSADAQSNIKWGPAPSVLPAGAELAVLEGDPSKSEPFTIRLRLPDGYRIPPHTHPTTENVTVLSGAFLAGMGGQFVESQMQTFTPGAFASIPANHAHYAMAKGPTVVQVHAMGPFQITYVATANQQLYR